MNSWLPLVPRPRPPAIPLADRTQALQDMAAQPPDGTWHQQLTHAAALCNLAALTASDCHDSTLARALCWRQYQVFHDARPVPDDAATDAIQPLLNIARQMIREGDSESAYTLLHTLFIAAKTETGVDVDGHQIALHELTSGTLPALIQTVWVALLADGTRALALQGRWQDAVDHAASHRGIGNRLLDGRQIAILAHTQHGDHDQALELLDQTAPTEPWEDDVRLLLRLRCQPSSAVADHALKRATEILADDAGVTVFQTRYALLALDHATPPDHSDTALLDLVVDVADRDAHAAHDLLTHPRSQHLTDTQRTHLAAQVTRCGLGLGIIPPPHHQRVITAAATGERNLRTLLSATAANETSGVMPRV